MKYVVLGLLLGLLVAFPPLAVHLGLALASASCWAASQPLLWAFLAGVIARPRVARRFGGAR